MLEIFLLTSWWLFPSSGSPHGGLTGRTGEPTKHDAAHCRVGHGHRHIWEPLVVLGETPRLSEPGEGPLDDPPARQNLEPAKLLERGNLDGCRRRF
jgi:hypothetical protein